MIKDSDMISFDYLNQNEKDILAFGKKGIERETLRIDKNNLISQDSHNKYLGSALCHKYITTDFSEALLEFVTPAFQKKEELISFLSESHHYVSKKIKKEKLWPLSMPPHFDHEDDIPIAKYGISNQALLKTIYRNGLVYRYGKAMQAISGVHFNYSFSEQIWNFNLLESKNITKKKLKEIIYFRALRNMHKMNWIVLYFFGASPIVDKNFLGNHQEDFKNYKDAIYLPNATSLRMSNLGYQNFNQSKIAVSLDTLEDYIESLYKLTNTHNPKFSLSSKTVDKLSIQLNANQLQIEDEYYAISRPKSSEISDLRAISKLKKFGVDYLEFRSLDINPFSPVGIDLKTINFLEAFIMFCAFSPSPILTEKDVKEFRNNNLLVAKKGREPNLELTKDNKKIKLKTWANQILELMQPYFEIYSSDRQDSMSYKEQVEDPETTLSGKFMETVFNSNMDLNEFGIRLANKNKRHFVSLDKDKNSIWELLDRETINSQIKQRALDIPNSESFQTHLEKYLKS